MLHGFGGLYSFCCGFFGFGMYMREWSSVFYVESCPRELDVVDESGSLR